MHEAKPDAAGRPAFMTDFLRQCSRAVLESALAAGAAGARRDCTVAACPAVTRRSGRVENAENGIFIVDLLQSWRQYALRVVSSTF